MIKLKRREIIELEGNGMLVAPDVSRLSPEF